MFKTPWDEWESRFINRFPRNLTQTAYVRFLRGPEAGLKTRFTESQKELEDRIKVPIARDFTKTAYLPHGIGGRDDRHESD